MNYSQKQEKLKIIAQFLDELFGRFVEKDYFCR
jgi:hypothetical protein